MAAVVNNDMVRVQILCSTSSQISVNVKFAKVQDLTVPTTTYSIANNEFGILQVRYANLIATDAFMRQVRVSVWSVANQSWSLPAIISGNIQGIGNAQAPGQLCGFIRNYADGAPGRSALGRCYFPFPSAIYVAPGGYITDIYKNKLESMLLLGWSNVGYTYQFGGLRMQPYRQYTEWRDPDDHSLGKNTLFTPITGGEVSRAFATQRRRGNFGKANFFRP